jgi:hypothetical protein
MSGMMLRFHRVAFVSPHKIIVQNVQAKYKREFPRIKTAEG